MKNRKIIFAFAMLLNIVFNYKIFAQSPCFNSYKDFTYLASVNSNTSSSVIIALSADFNNDSKNDVVTANSLSSQISLVLNTSSNFPTFLAPTSFNLSSNIRTMEVADFNNDGKMDIIALTTNTTSNIAILYGNGVGGFSLPLYYTTLSGSQVYSVRVADVNNDGIKDAVISGQFGYLTVFLGTLSFSLSQQISLLVAPSSNVVDFTINDFNNDSNNDILFIEGSSNVGTILQGYSAGSFSITSTFTLSSGIIPIRLTVADFNLDSYFDVIFSASSGLTSLYLNSTLLSFNYNSNIAVGNNITGLSTSDFNNDGKPDLVFCYSVINATAIMYNLGSNTFSNRLTYFTGYSGIVNSSNIFRDFNNDGYKEIVMPSEINNVLILKNLISKFDGIANAPQLGLGGNRSVASDDFNGDGFSDLVFCNQNSNSVYVSINNGNGNYSLPTIYSVGTYPTAVRVSDFNNDGIKDIAVSNITSNNTSILLGIGTGSFGFASNYNGGGFTLEIADLNNDGKKDIVTNNNILLNNGTGGFLAPTFYAFGGNFMTLNDFNNDGNIDLVADGSIYKGLGNGTFSASVAGVTGITAIGATTSGDFDLDTKLDLAYTNTVSNLLIICKGSGNFNFVVSNSYPIVSSATAIATKDINNDGDLDLVISHYNSGTASILNGLSTTAFSSPLNIKIGYNLTISAFGLLNNDNLIDVIFLWFIDGAISSYNKTAYISPSTTITLCQGSPIILTAINANTYGNVNWSTGANTNSITIISNGIYSYTLSTASCASSTSYSATFNNLPFLTINSGSICSGQSFTITPNGASTYTYSSGANIISPTTNTTINVTGTSLQGCVSSNTAISSVTVNTTPTITINSSTICTGQSFTINPNGANTYTLSSGSNIISPTTNTTVNVIGTSLQGCVSSNTAVSSVVVNTTPTITANSGTICSGQSFAITPNGASTYTYSSGTNVITPTTNTNVNVIGTSSLGCISSNTAISSVTVNPIPIINTTSSNSIICTGQTATLTASGATTYTWSSGGTSAIEVITPNLTTTYTVNGTNASGCSNSSIITQNVSLCTGIPPFTNTSQSIITVFPNPTNNSINIQSVFLVNRVNIYSTTGNLVKACNSEIISVTDLKNGLYFIEVIDEKGSVTKSKFIKQ